MFNKSYSQQELEELLGNNTVRKGWDFSQMNTQRQPVPWDYIDVVLQYLRPEDRVLDIGTGGGERFLQISKFFKTGVGIDIDPKMVKIAKENEKGTSKVSFYKDSEKLENTEGIFDVIINRHAPFDPAAIFKHLKPGGYFIMQQVGEKNMGNIKKVLNRPSNIPIITKDQIENSGLKLLTFKEYNVEYIVKDVKSLVFWLAALDMLHSDLHGKMALENVGIFNEILKGNIDDRGFVTNEHRYLVVAQKKI